MGEALQLSVTLTSIDCGRCGGTYAINERYRQKCSEDGTGWTCPYCKSGWGYFSNGENARLRKRLEQEEKRRRWAESERDRTELRRRAQQGVNTRLKKRIGAGVCPCCKRSFKQLREHMKRQHPEYAQEAGAE